MPQPGIWIVAVNDDRLPGRRTSVSYQRSLLQEHQRALTAVSVPAGRLWAGDRGFVAARVDVLPRPAPRRSSAFGSLLGGKPG